MFTPVPECRRGGRAAISRMEGMNANSLDYDRQNERVLTRAIAFVGPGKVLRRFSFMKLHHRSVRCLSGEFIVYTARSVKCNVCLERDAEKPRRFALARCATVSSLAHSSVYRWSLGKVLIGRNFSFLRQIHAPIAAEPSMQCVVKRAQIEKLSIIHFYSLFHSIEAPHPGMMGMDR